jgi:hypothetical protein
MRCRRAAADRTSSQSGKVSVGIAFPKVIALGIGILHVRIADSAHLLHDDAICERCTAQFGPVLAPATVDHVVDSREGEILVVEMAVEHGRQQCFTLLDESIINREEKNCSNLLRFQTQ